MSTVEYVILGHQNPDVDSIVSGYLLETLQAVERGNQHESDDQLSDREARDHLHVGKAVYGDVYKRQV